jgi:hypothetical protein
VSFGAAFAQSGSANAQRVWKRQPDGGSIGLGGSPVIGGFSVRLSGSEDGIAASSARV